MPSRNITKTYVADNYYHVYNRGVEKRDIFLDRDDYRVFLNLLKRHLAPESITDRKGREYTKYDLELLAFCLMPNHFHLLVYQKDKHAITQLMRSVITAYVMYFNSKYDRVGGLFQDAFKASMILEDNYLLHISRYIHLNPLDVGEEPHKYSYSSYPNYFSNNTSWIKPQRLLEIFNDQKINYADFIKDYEDHKKFLNSNSYII